MSVVINVQLKEDKFSVVEEGEVREVISQLETGLESSEISTTFRESSKLLTKN